MKIPWLFSERYTEATSRIQISKFGHASSSRAHAPLGLACDHSESMGCGTRTPPNLLKLESQHSSYRSCFLDAVDCNESLEHDVNRTRAESEARGWYTSSGLLVDRLRSLSAHHHHRIPDSSFPSDSASLSSSASSSWQIIHNATAHLSSLLIDPTLKRERSQRRNRGRIEVNHDDVEAKHKFREKQCQRNIDRGLNGGRDRVRKLEKKKRWSREMQSCVKMQAVALLEEFSNGGLMKRDVDEH